MSRDHAPLTPEALELVAARFRVLGERTRLELLQALFEGERTVNELAAAIGATQPNVSKHLALLAEHGLVARRQEGTFALYRIVDPSVRQLCALVCGSLERRFDRARDALSRTSPRSRRARR